MASDLEPLVRTQFALIKEQAKLINRLYASLLRGDLHKRTDAEGNDISLEVATRLDKRADE